jgi:hypothetical protein
MKDMPVLGNSLINLIFLHTEFIRRKPNGAMFQDITKIVSAPRQAGTGAGTV